MIALACTTAGFLSFDGLQHWFVLPVSLCGVLMLRDAMPWFRGRADILSPTAILGIFGTFFFYLAPLLHVVLDVWMRYVTAPTDWRPWLGWMATINLAGLSLYTLLRQRRKGTRAVGTQKWKLDRGRFAGLLVLAAVIALAAQATLWATTGGIGGYAAIYEDSLLTGQDALAGKGWLVVLGESFPSLLFMGFLVAARRRRGLRASGMLSLSFLACIGLQFLFGGMRGSRANTVWFAVWAVGAVHCWLRKVPRPVIYAGGFAILLFTFLLGFAKDVGFSEGLAIKSQADIDALTARTGRTKEATLLGDFGRSDVQAFVLYRSATDHYSPDLALGRTYLGDIAMLVPKAVWQDRPPGKSKWTTETEYGQGSYPTLRSSRIYGLVGEFALNFGFWLSPLAFVPLAFCVRSIESWPTKLDGNDPRRLLFPFAAILPIVLVAFDLDNCVWLFTKFVVPLGVIILLSLRPANALGRRGTRETLSKSLLSRWQAGRLGAHPTAAP